MPALFFSINEQRARQELDFVAESIKHKGSRQESRIHENAFAKGSVVRHGPGLLEGENLLGKICWQLLIFENNIDIRDARCGLINQKSGLTRRIGCKSHAPWSFHSSPVLDYRVEYDVHDQGDCKRHDEVAQQVVRFHSAPNFERAGAMSSRLLLNQRRRERLPNSNQASNPAAARPPTSAPARALASRNSASRCRS